MPITTRSSRAVKPRGRRLLEVLMDRSWNPRDASCGRRGLEDGVGAGPTPAEDAPTEQ